MHSYIPTSVVLTLCILKVELLCPIKTAPFLNHWYVKSVGVPPATTLISTELPEDTVCGSLMLIIYAGAEEKKC